MTEALTALTAVQNDPAFPALKLDIAWHGIADEKMMSRLFSRLEQVNVAASDLRAKMHGKKDMQLQNSMSAAGILILGAFDRCGVKYSNRETSLFYLVMKRLFGDQLETVAFQKVRNKNGLRNIIDEAIRKHKVENVQRANQSAANNAINRL
jgi:hypothetical protein